MIDSCRERNVLDRGGKREEGSRSLFLSPFSLWSSGSKGSEGKVVKRKNFRVVESVTEER